MREPTVASLMTTDVVTIGPGLPVKDIAALLTERGIAAVPVVGEDGTLLGVVSEADLVSRYEFGRSAPRPGGVLAGRRRERWQRSRGEIAYTVMASPVVTIGPDEPAGAAASRLAGANVRRLFVVDGRGRLIGVLSRRDLLGVFLRGDEQIRADVDERALARVRWADPSACRAEVRHGVVTLLGSVATGAERELAGRLAGQIPGVVAVHNALDPVFEDAGRTPD